MSSLDHSVSFFNHLEQIRAMEKEIEKRRAALMRIQLDKLWKGFIENGTWLE